MYTVICKRKCRKVKELKSALLRVISENHHVNLVQTTKTCGAVLMRPYRIRILHDDVESDWTGLWIS